MTYLILPAAFLAGMAWDWMCPPIPPGYHPTW